MSYDDLKALAREKREEYGIETPTLNLNVMKAVYKKEGIAVDLWKLSPRIRATYMCDGGDPSVLINKTLPREPRLFAMAHELKHHFVDRAILEAGEAECGDYNANRAIEIGAEVFAAEFVFPEAEFVSHLERLRMTGSPVGPEQVVRFKREVKAPVSYKFLVKRFEFLGLVPKGQFGSVQFQKLEESIYGEPIYKQAWFRSRRASKTLAKLM